MQTSGFELSAPMFQRKVVVNDAGTACDGPKIRVIGTGENEIPKLELYPKSASDGTYVACTYAFALTVVAPAIARLTFIPILSVAIVTPF